MEEDRVHRLRAEARHREQLGAHGRKGRPAQPGEPAAETREQPRGEGTKPARLQAVGARRADHFGQRGLRHGHEPAGIEQAPRAQRRHAARGAGPRGVLRENRADGDLVRAASRPPALRPEAAQEAHVQAKQARLHGVARRPGNPAPAGKR